jgi:hypothetical protein
MKLDDDQSIAPVPWPIQSSPRASARKPTIKSNLRMGISPFPTAGAAALQRVACALAQSKSGDDESEQCRRQPEPQKSPGRCRGF